MDYSGLTGRKMLDRYEQVRFFSDGEFLRRQRVVIEKMKAQDVELLLIANPKLEGFGVWLADDMLCDYIMLDREGLVTVVYGHEFGAGRDFAAHTERKVGIKPVTEPRLPNVEYKSGLDTAYISSMVGRSRRIGIINRDCLRREVYTELLEKTPGLEFADMRVAVSMLRVVRSAEEKDAIGYTARVLEKIMHAIPMMMREGRYLRDVVMDIQHFGYEMGSGRDEVQLFTLFTGMENDGRPLPRWVAPMPTCVDVMPEKIEKGWRSLVMLEMNSYGGMMLDTGRMFSLGEPHPVTVKAWEDAVKIQGFAVERLRPGMTCRRIMEESQEYARGMGVELIFGNFCHGLGNSRTEGPDVRDPSNWELPFVTDMHLLCEPNTARQDKPGDPPSVILVPDSFYVSENGGVPVTRLPHDIVVID